MWDWDQPPPAPAPPKPANPRALTRGDRIGMGAIAIVTVLMLAASFGAVLRIGADSGPVDRDTAAAGAEALGAERPNVATGGLDVVTAEPYTMRPGDALTLRDRHSVLTVTAGRLVAGKADCATRPHVAVELTVTLTGTRQVLVPDMFWLDTNGRHIPPIAACSFRPALLGDGDEEVVTVVYESGSGRRLLYGPDGRDPLAAWILG